MMTTTLALLEKVMEAQKTDKECNFINTGLEAGEEFPYWTFHKDGSLRYAERVFVPPVFYNAPFFGALQTYCNYLSFCIV